MAEESASRGSTKTSTGRGALAGKAIVAGVLAAGAGLFSPGAASADPVGTFTGLEYPGTDTTYPLPSPLCATYTGSFSHVLQFAGGTATFTSSATYDANPEGLYEAGTNCLVPSRGVPGTLSVTGAVSCSNVDATYNRRATSAYALTSTDPCGGSLLEFVGVQVPCVPFAPCSDPDAGSSMIGVYAQV